MRRGLFFLATVALCVADLPINPTSVAHAASPRVILNELHYHPVDDNPDGEFIELFNTTGAAVNLSNWCISGTGFCFGSGASIAANGFLVITSAMYDGALSNSGERIRLRDQDGATIDDVTYADVGEWPAIADGDGHSLQRRDPMLSATSPGNWLSAPPSPGAPNTVAGTGLLPVWRNVTHTVLPAPGAPLNVSATLDNATSGTLFYRVGFGPEVAVPMAMSGSTATAAIPGQVGGSLVRYRLSAISPTNGSTGTWPRQGDGSTFTGTTVATSTTSHVARFEWFMDDFAYALALQDLTLRGDEGYPAIFAYNGQIFDGAKIRVKGQVSRSFPKKKWKVTLPSGHSLDIPGVLPEAVNEFSLHGSYTDKSFIREILASEMMTAAGMPTSQVFPVRLEKNGQFYGLYNYVEQEDGTWRERFGLDEAVVYDVGGNTTFGTLAANDANLSQTALRNKYDKKTFEYANDDALRNFIRTVNSLSGAAERNWIYANVDVPSVVNALAASVVIQHQDWGHKNYQLYLGTDGRWGVIPNDHDLVLGRRWSTTTGALESRVYVGGAFEHPGGPFFETFWFDPELSQMVRRRIRELTLQLLDPATVSARVAQLNALVRNEAALDRLVWPVYGTSQSAEAAGNEIVSAYATPQYYRVLGTMAAQGRVARTQQPAVPSVRIATVVHQPNGATPEHLTLTNDSNDTVDISGFTIEGIDFVVPGGTVLLPGRTIVFASEEAGSTAGTFSCCLVGSRYPDDIDDGGERLTLRTRNGTDVSVYNLNAANAQTEITGFPNRSALVSIVSTDNIGSGYVQVLPCGTAPGASSNLNVDTPKQIRAVLAVVQFDAAGKACIYNQTGSHVIADLQGYFAPGAFDDVVDIRILDTRNGPRPSANTQTVINGLPNRSAMVSLVATGTTGPSYLQVLPCGSTPGASSNLNVDAANQTRATLAVVQFDATGTACIYNQSSTHIVADLQGYFAPGTFDDIADVRLLDTRNNAKPANNTQSPMTGEAGRSGLVSIVATEAVGPGFLQILPCGTGAGASSNLNVDAANQTIASLSVAPFDGAGQACTYNQTSTHIVVDLQGYFVAGTFDDVPDVRLVDTRTR